MGTSRDKRPIQVLVVEDSPTDARLLDICLKKSSIPMRIHRAIDGVQAMEFLEGRDGHAGAPAADLVLLDLNLPRLDGREVLSAMRVNPALRSTPVVILSSSRAPEDVQIGYERGANCYICKGDSLEEFQEAVAAIEAFWFRIAELP